MLVKAGWAAKKKQSQEVGERARTRVGHSEAWGARSAVQRREGSEKWEKALLAQFPLSHTLVLHPETVVYSFL